MNNTSFTTSPLVIDQTAGTPMNASAPVSDDVAGNVVDEGVGGERGQGGGEVQLVPLNAVGVNGSGDGIIANSTAPVVVMFAGEEGGERGDVDELAGDGTREID